jgi:dihydrodipicolinate synthase/N-acetylneuraminate lyase
MPTRFPQILLGAAMLPWREDFSLDEPLFRAHIRSIVQQGYQHVYLMGTAGEGYALTDRQFQQVVAIFWEEMQQPGLQPMVGVISLSMGQIIERIAWSHRLGIRHFQISLPSWGTLTDEEMVTFFQGVCGRFPDSQFLHYNLPRTKRVVTGADYRRIADAVPNLAATKNSTSDFARIADLMVQAPDCSTFLSRMPLPLVVFSANARCFPVADCCSQKWHGGISNLAGRAKLRNCSSSTNKLARLFQNCSDTLPRLILMEPTINSLSGC